MAKSQLNFKRTITDKVQVKGTLSEDGSSVFYDDENKVEQEVKISDMLKPFINQEIDLSVNLKSEEEFVIEPSDDE